MDEKDVAAAPGAPRTSDPTSTFSSSNNQYTVDIQSEPSIDLLDDEEEEEEEDDLEYSRHHTPLSNILDEEDDESSSVSSNSNREEVVEDQPPERKMLFQRQPTQKMSNVAAIDNPLNYSTSLSEDGAGYEQYYRARQDSTEEMRQRLDSFSRKVLAAAEEANNYGQYTERDRLDSFGRKATCLHTERRSDPSPVVSSRKQQTLNHHAPPSPKYNFPQPPISPHKIESTRKKPVAKSSNKEYTRVTRNSVNDAVTPKAKNKTSYQRKYMRNIPLVSNNSLDRERDQGRNNKLVSPPSPRERPIGLPPKRNVPHNTVRARGGSGDFGYNKSRPPRVSTSGIHPTRARLGSDGSTSNSKHFRRESDSSQSTVGSSGGPVGLSARIGDDVKQFLSMEGQGHRHQRSGSWGDALIRTLTGRPRSDSIEDLTQDYHDRNQAFLQNVQREQGRQQYQQQHNHIRRRTPPNIIKETNTMGDLSPLHKSTIRSRSPRPPVTSGHRPGLPSIENDRWDEMDEKGVNKGRTRKVQVRERSSKEDDSNESSSDEESSGYSSSDDDSTKKFVQERTLLLTPSGIDTYEGGSRSKKSSKNHPDTPGRSSRRKSHRHNNYPEDELYSTSSSDEERSSINQRQRRHKGGNRASKRKSYGSISENKIAELHAKWLKEHEAEEERNRWYNRFSRWLYKVTGPIEYHTRKVLLSADAALSNLPLTTAGISCAMASMSSVWFKWTEELIDACIPVHYRSPACVFPEYPGCFECNTEDDLYRTALLVHYSAQIICALVGAMFVAKVLIAWPVFADEMSNPTTSSPAGLICISIVVISAGKGWIGEILTYAATCVHLAISSWYIYTVLAYNALPDPTWNPNTIGIGMCAIKVWIYNPTLGYILMFLCVIYFIAVFPISVIRVIMNPKIAAPVCALLFSAPSTALYAYSIMGQPSQYEEEHMDLAAWKENKRLYYMPVMNMLFFASLVGSFTALGGIFLRRKQLFQKEFSPAYAAFAFPPLNHANAVQAYRSAVDAFYAEVYPPGSPFKVALDTYWFTILFCGTLVTSWITINFLTHLPSWVFPDVTNEEEPPAPNETMISELIQTQTGDSLVQNFVSPAVLQANETGALVRVSDAQGNRKFARTRRVTALGFEPIMNWLEMAQERELLLDHVVKHPPRTRKRTLSVPGIDFDFGVGHGRGVWGYDSSDSDFTSRGNRTRSNTADLENAGGISRIRGNPGYYY